MSHSENNIYGLDVTKRTINDQQLHALVEYVIRNRFSDKLDDGLQKKLMLTKTNTNTPITKIFNRLVDMGKDSIFSVYDIPKTNDINEILTYQHVPFDFLQIVDMVPSLGAAINSSEFRDRIIINATPWLTANGDLSDAPKFQATVTRDILVRSYFKSRDDVWISPALVRLLARIYSMALSNILENKFILTVYQKEAVACIFCYLFLSKCLKKEDDVNALILNPNSFLNLGQKSNIEDVLDLINKVKGSRQMTLSIAIECIRSLGINKLEAGLNLALFIRWTAYFGSDRHTSAISLEFPPYKLKKNCRF